MSEVVQIINKTLLDHIDSSPEKIARFFKTGVGDYAEHDRFIGLSVPSIRKLAKKFIFIEFEDLLYLLKSVFNEERLLALIILVYKFDQASSQDRQKIYDFYLSNLVCVNNWNLVDSSAHLIIGKHLSRQKDRSILNELAGSQNIWQRRISIVSTWYFIRKDDLDWTFKIADLLQKDSHDLIHKAVGWMLREAGKKNQETLLAYLSVNAACMPKTMLRYASEKLSKEQKSSFKYS